MLYSAKHTFLIIYGKINPNILNNLLFTSMSIGGCVGNMAAILIIYTVMKSIEKRVKYRFFFLNCENIR